MVTFRQSLTSGKPLLLDGATGTELEKQGLNINDPLWSGIVVLSHPTQLQNLHLSYLSSGSDVILTASYQLYDTELLKRNLNPDEIYNKSIELCTNARTIHSKQTGKNSYIAGSIGPYGVLYFDGSEYTGNYRNATDSEIAEFHSHKLEVFHKSAQVDLIAFETIPSFQEIKILVNLINTLNATTGNKPKHYYLSCTVDAQNQLADGTQWSEVLTYLNANTDEYLIAIGSNCCKLNQSAEIITNINDALTQCPNLLSNKVKIIIYPNSGEVYNGITKDWATEEPTDQPLHDQIETIAKNAWLQCGQVGIIGGCCRTCPDDIKVLRSLIDEKYNDL